MPKIQAISARDNPLLAQVRRLIRQPDAYRKHAAVWLEVEAKLAERPHALLPKGINPHHLNNARRRLTSR